MPHTDQTPTLWIDGALVSHHSYTEYHTTVWPGQASQRTCVIETVHSVLVVIISHRFKNLRGFFIATVSPFQRQVTIIQNAINNWHTLRDNISDPHAETLSQTAVSCSYVLSVIIAKYVPIQRDFYDNRKTAIFL